MATPSRRVLVTGARGFTGIHLRRELEAAGNTVIGLSNETGGGPFDYRADLNDAGAIARAVRVISPDDVIHLAAISFVAHEQVDDVYKTNVLGTLHLLSALSAMSCRPRRVILASSANVYGDVVADSIDESCPCAPVSHYAASKVAMEAVASVFHSELSITITRPFNYTGPGQSLRFLVPKLVDHFARRSPRVELGNLEVERDFLDVRTVATIYRRLLESDAAAGQVINVCSGHGTPLADIVTQLERITGHEIAVDVNPVFVRRNEIRRLVGSDRRVRGLIGDTPEIPFEQTLRDMLDAHSH